MDLKAILISTLVLFTASAWAQMAPTPGAEVKKLDYFVGTWAVEGTIAPGPWGTGGKFSSTDTSEWMPGKFFVEGHSDFKMPPELGGDGMAVSYMGYDTNENVYTYNEFNSQGRRENSKGTVSADTWTWTSTQNYGGQEIKQKMAIKVLTPTSYTLKFDVSTDGTNWMPFMEAKATKK
ncbi:MAG TPA: DUF1579 family protein [Candidatus Sulfotelmatobacter sp.]|nr:DUF1579 family protein [Candidatus Sulfotelmatobacter sp.]